MPNLYDILGVDKNADKKSIRKAYRNSAKKNHPDHGGGKEKFGQLTLAHDILIDDARRAKYDATGDASEKEPDNEYSVAVNIVAVSLNAVLADCASAGQSPLEIDIVAKVKKKIEAQIPEAQKQIRIQSCMLVFDKKLVGRFSKKQGGEPNIFEAIVSNRIQMLSASMANLEKIIKDSEGALKMIDGVVYKKDEAPYESRGDAMMRRMSGGFSLVDTVY